MYSDLERALHGTPSVSLPAIYMSDDGDEYAALISFVNVENDHLMSVNLVYFSPYEEQGYAENVFHQRYACDNEPCWRYPYEKERE